MSIIDTKKLLKNLKENPLGGDTLAKEIGISKQIIVELRNGNKDVDSLTIRNAKKIQAFFKNNENNTWRIL